MHGRVGEAAAATAAAVVGVVVVVDARASECCSVSLSYIGALQERRRTTVRRIEEHGNERREKRPLKERENSGRMTRRSVLACMCVSLSLSKQRKGRREMPV